MGKREGCRRIPVAKLYMQCLSSRSRNMSTDAPFGEKPYLCGSQLMEVTPSSEKSATCGGGKPAADMKGRRKPPRQQSRWRPIPRERASAESSSIGSMTPCGKVGAEA